MEQEKKGVSMEQEKEGVSMLASIIAREYPALLLMTHISNSVTTDIDAAVRT